MFGASLPLDPSAMNPIAVALLLPLIGALLVQLFGRWENLRDTVTIVVGICTFQVVLSILPFLERGVQPTLHLIEVVPGLSLAFRVEPLGMLFALVASGLWILTSAYAYGYMRGHHEKNQTRFFTCFALAIHAALGIAFARNLFTLFVFYEVLTVSTYPLVTHHQNKAARRSGRIYLGILFTTSVGLFLFGLGWTYAIAGTLEFTPGGILDGKTHDANLAILLGLFALGTGKAALWPFHKWLPNAMVAPTPVSALLHAVAVVKAGVFTVLKIAVYIFGIEVLARGVSEWLTFLAAFTLLYTSIRALTKDNLKARLAYSTISQLAYIVLAAALATKSSMIGGAMHIAMHAFGKITLFFCAGAIMVGAHKKNISDMDGIGRAMPFTMLAFFVGSLSVIGLPPSGGSWSKWYMALGAAETGDYWAVGVYMLSSLLAIGYLMPVVGRAFFAKPSEPKWAEGIQEAPLLCVLPPCLTAFGCVVLFFYAPELQAMLAPMVEVP